MKKQGGGLNLNSNPYNNFDKNSKSTLDLEDEEGVVTVDLYQKQSTAGFKARMDLELIEKTDNNSIWDSLRCCLGCSRVRKQKEFEIVMQGDSSDFSINR